MKIMLLRHGRPQKPRDKWLSAQGFQKWLQEFNAMGIVPDSIPPKKLSKEIVDYQGIVVSGLGRSRESAIRLGIKPERWYESDIFKEAQLPSCNWKIPLMKPWCWALVLRVFWYLGYSKECESFYLFQKRAKEAAGELIERAGEGQNVVLIGHQLLNYYISNELIQKGWRGSRPWKMSYWNYFEYDLGREDYKGPRC